MAVFVSHHSNDTQNMKIVNRFVEVVIFTSQLTFKKELEQIKLAKSLPLRTSRIISYNPLSKKLIIKAGYNKVQY
jgi:uroporphyrinogen-III synthase